MKEYRVKMPACIYNMDMCDSFLKRMAQEGFILTRIKFGGRFYFEYNADADKYEYYSFLNISGLWGAGKLNKLHHEMRLVYYTAEPIRQFTSLNVYRIEPLKNKDKKYLNNIAHSRGVSAFTHDEYLSALRQTRNTILMSNKTFLGIIYSAFAALILICSAITLTWWGICACIIPIVLAVRSFLHKKALGKSVEQAKA